MKPNGNFNLTVKDVERIEHALLQLQSSLTDDKDKNDTDTRYTLKK